MGREGRNKAGALIAAFGNTVTVMMPKPHINEAQKIATRLNADAVVVIAFRDGNVGAASYGRDGLRCKAAGKWVDIVIDAMCSGSGTLPAPEL